MAESNERPNEVQTHPIIQALRETLRKMAMTLSPDIAPADVYSPGESTAQEKSNQ